MDRRTFLGTVAAAGFGAAFEAHSAGEPGQFAGVAAGTFVWTQVLGKQGKDPKENLDLIFEEIHSAGYEGVETFADYVAKPVQAARMTGLLDEHQLKLTGLYRGGVFHEEEKAKKTVDEIGQLAEIALALDCLHIIVNPDPLPDREKTDQELDIQAQNLNKAGELAKNAGVGLDVHFHAPELRNDARELRWDMDKTDPALVFLCDDVHWMYRGGVDPYALLEKYGPRVRGTHLRNSVGGVWSEELGPGDIDYARIAERLKKVGYTEWLTVELAIEDKTPQTRPLVESMKMSREFIRQTFGA